MEHTTLPSMYMGLRLVSNASMVIPRTTITRRTWRERLFSRPWTPLKAITVTVTHEPYPEVFRIKDYLVGHPDTLAKLIEGLEATGYRGDESRG